MIMAVPVVLPVTMPVVLPMPAIDVLLLLQAPPPVASVSVVVLPGQTRNVPPMAAGPEVTVTLFVAVHPVGMV